MSNCTEGGTGSPPTAVHRLPRSQGYPYVAAFVVEVLFTIIGNLVALAVFRKNKQMRQRKPHWLLVNQAAVDLLAGPIAVPLGLYYYLSYHFDLWQYHDDLYLYLAVDAIMLLLTFASLYNLLIIALERTYATFMPIRHRVLSAENYRVAIAVVWFLPLLPICPRVAARLKIISLTTFYYILGGTGFVIFLLVVSSYASIWIKLKCSTVHPQNDLRAARERRLTASVFLVTAASFVTYFTGIIVSIVVAVLYYKGAMSFYSGSHANMCSLLLVCANFFINPVIYSFKMPGFSRAAILLICGIRPRTTNAALSLRTVQRNRGNGRL